MQCGICGTTRGVIGKFPTAGLVCSLCAGSPAPSIAFERHHGKCWDYDGGEIVMRLLHCSSCKNYFHSLAEDEE